VPTAHGHIMPLLHTSPCWHGTTEQTFGQRDSENIPASATHSMQRHRNLAYYALLRRLLNRSYTVNVHRLHNK